MNQKYIPPKKLRDRDTLDPEEIQDRLTESACIPPDHGGHEHSHDWDDYLKVDRALKSKGSKKKRTYSKPLELEG